MKERILELLNSTNRDDIVLGILLIENNNLWEQVSKPNNLEVVDSSVTIRYLDNGLHRIICKGKAFCIQGRQIHRYREFFYPRILQSPGHVIYTDNSL